MLIRTKRREHEQADRGQRDQSEEGHGLERARGVGAVEARDPQSPARLDFRGLVGHDGRIARPVAAGRGLRAVATPSRGVRSSAWRPGHAQRQRQEHRAPRKPGP